jgi:hypothetical protein
MEIGLVLIIEAVEGGIMLRMAWSGREISHVFNLFLLQQVVYLGGMKGNERTERFWERIRIQRLHD